MVTKTGAQTRSSEASKKVDVDFLVSAVSAAKETKAEREPDYEMEQQVYSALVIGYYQQKRPDIVSALNETILRLRTMVRNPEIQKLGNHPVWEGIIDEDRSPEQALLTICSSVMVFEVPTPEIGIAFIGFTRLISNDPSLIEQVFAEETDE